MELTLRQLTMVAGKTTPKAMAVAFWMVTGLFCVEMSFTAWYELMRLAGGGAGVHPARLFRCLVPNSRGPSSQRQQATNLALMEF